MLLLLFLSLHWNRGIFFFPKCFMSIMWTCLSHTSAILFFFLHPSPDATKNVLFCYILPQQQFTVHIMQLLHLFFFRFWTILIINKWRHEVGKNGNIQKWLIKHESKKKSRNINSCTERICVFSVALQNNNIHISTYFQLKVWFHVVLLVACLSACFCYHGSCTNRFAKEF